MDSKERAKIIDELNERIQDATNLDEHDAVFALENFREWFFEYYVY